LASISSCTKHRSVGSSDKRRMHRCPWRRFFRRGGPLGLATPIFSISLSSLEPKSLRIVILTIILVQVLCCHSITKITRNGINGAIFVTNIGLLCYEVAHISGLDHIRFITSYTCMPDQGSYNHTCTLHRLVHYEGSDRRLRGGGGGELGFLKIKALKNYNY